VSELFPLQAVDSLARHWYASHRHRQSCTLPRLAAALFDRCGFWANPQSESGGIILLVYDVQQMEYSIKNLLLSFLAARAPSLQKCSFECSFTETTFDSEADQYVS